MYIMLKINKSEFPTHNHISAYENSWIYFKQMIASQRLTDNKKETKGGKKKHKEENKFKLRKGLRSSCIVSIHD